MRMSVEWRLRAIACEPNRYDGNNEIGAAMLEAADKIESLHGQAGILRKLLAQADGVLGTLVPESTDEAELLGQLRAGIGGALVGSEA